MTLIKLMRVINISQLQAISILNARQLSTSSSALRLKSEWRLSKPPAETKIAKSEDEVVIEKKRVFGGGHKLYARSLFKSRFELRSLGIVEELQILDVVYSETVKTREEKILARGAYISVNGEPIRSKLQEQLEKLPTSVTNNNNDTDSSPKPLSAFRLKKLQEDAKTRGEEAVAKSYIPNAVEFKDKDNDSEALVSADPTAAEAQTVSQAFLQALESGTLYARVLDRPGQVARADGYLLEGDELESLLAQLNQE